MLDAIDRAYTIDKIKLELSKVSDGEYKGRTQYWKIANDILEE